MVQARPEFNKALAFCSKEDSELKMFLIKNPPSQQKSSV
jgi:hypothetical protein